MSNIIDTFAVARPEGRPWSTNGFWFVRKGGKTKRIPAPAQGQTPGGSGTSPASPPPPATPPSSRPPQPKAGFFRKLALEYWPKIRSIPSMLPGIAATTALGIAGTMTGTLPGVMLGSVAAGGMLNKAMDRGSKRAKLYRSKMARSDAEKRWAVGRNRDAYFGELDYYRELRDLTAEFVSAFGEGAHHLFASKHKDGESWTTNGIHFKRENGVTRRVAAPKQIAPEPVSPGPFAAKKADREPVLRRSRTLVGGKPIVAVGQTRPTPRPTPTPEPPQPSRAPGTVPDFAALAKKVDGAIVGPKRSLNWGYDFTKAHATVKAAHKEIDDFAREQPRKVATLARQVTGQEPTSTEHGIKLLKDFVAESVALLDKSGGRTHGMSERVGWRIRGLRLLAEAFAERPRDEHEQWETKGRWYQQINGTAVRIPNPRTGHDDRSKGERQEAEAEFEKYRNRPMPQFPRERDHSGEEDGMMGVGGAALGGLAGAGAALGGLTTGPLGVGVGAAIGGLAGYGIAKYARLRQRAADIRNRVARAAAAGHAVKQKTPGVLRRVVKRITGFDERGRPVYEFAWHQGKRGSRYWLPDGKQDIPANRLYGAKAEKAANAGQRKEAADVPATGAKPDREQSFRLKVAAAKFEVARDAHRTASQPGSGVPAHQVKWLADRMAKAKQDLDAIHPTAGKPVGDLPKPAAKVNKPRAK